MHILVFSLKHACKLRCVTFYIVGFQIPCISANCVLLSLLTCQLLVLVQSTFVALGAVAPLLGSPLYAPATVDTVVCSVRMVRKYAWCLQWFKFEVNRPVIKVDSSSWHCKLKHYGYGSVLSMSRW